MLVWEHPELLESLQHRQTWASDSFINQALINHYAGYDYLYECREHNEPLFAAKIAEIHDRMAHLYETTQYEYEPLVNYDMTEHNEGSNHADRTPDLTDKTDSTSDAYGFNDADESAPQTKTESTHTSTGSDHTEGGNEYTLTRKGNIGIMTAQDCIKKEREINISMIEEYVKEFADCFNLSNTVSHGDFMRRY